MDSRRHAFCFRFAGGLLEQLCAQPRRGRAPGLAQPLADLRLQPRKLGSVRSLQGRIVHHHLAGSTAGEDAVERVKIPLADGIKLVIVTPGAGNGEPKKGLREDIDLVVDDLHLIIQCVHRNIAELDHAQMRQSEHGFVQAFGAVETRIRQQIPGDVFADELVVGHVAVEGADEVIPVTPGHRQFRVALAAVRFAVANQIHPVPRPTLPEPRRGEQPIHSLLVGIGRSVATEVLDLVDGGRQSRQRECDATQQRLAAGRRGRPKPAFLHLREEKPINRMLRPRGVLHLGHGRLSHRLKTPPVFARLEGCLPAHVGRRRGRRNRRRLVTRIDRALVDPGHKIRDDGIRKLRPVLRHFGIRGLVSDALDEQALLRITRYEHRAGVSALAQSVPIIHAQSALLLLCPVTFVAFIDQRRPDALLEKIEPVWRRRKRGSNGKYQDAQSNPGSPGRRAG